MEKSGHFRTPTNPGEEAMRSELPEARSLNGLPKNEILLEDLRRRAELEDEARKIMEDGF